MAARRARTDEGAPRGDDAALARGEPYPESAFERAAPVCRLGGGWRDAADGRVRVRFVLSSAGWGGRDDRRPEWLQVMDAETPLWPERELPAGDWRLNLDPLRGCLFGRLRGWLATTPRTASPPPGGRPQAAAT